MGEGQRRQVGSQSVGAGAPGPLRFPHHHLASGERGPRVGGELRLDADHRGGRAERLHRGGDAGGETATADRDQHDLDVGQLCDDLQPDGALSGDDPAVVVRRDQRAALLGGDPLRGVEPLGGWHQHHLAAERPYLIDLDRWCAFGNDHRARRGGGSGGVGEGLPVVAGRMGDHAPGALVGGEPGHRVRGTPELEGADRLEILRLEQQLVGPTAGQQRGTDGDVGDVGRRRPDLVERYEIHRPILPPVGGGMVAMPDVGSDKTPDGGSDESWGAGSDRGVPDPTRPVMWGSDKNGVRRGVNRAKA